MDVLSVTDARKSYGAVQALRGVSLRLGAGEMLALLGPNGAGKTTLVRAISGRVRLDAGAIALFGKSDGAAARADLGVVPQEIALYPLLTARENLQTFGSLQGLRGATLRERVDWALDWTGLGERAKEPVQRFSGGMKRRLNIACAVLHRPKVVLLDEPTVGVDPQSRERIWDMLDRLREGGASLLLTTHQLEEAETRSDRIVIIDHGTVIADGTLRDLIERTIGGQRTVRLALDRAPQRPLAGVETQGDATILRARVGDVPAELPALLQQVQAAGCRIDDVEVHRPSLQAVFLHLTGRELRE